MDKERFSLMTFPFLFDQTMRRVTTTDIFQIAQQSGISFLDIMDPSPRLVEEHLSCMRETNVRICCYIASISFLRGDAGAAIERHLSAAKALGAEFLMIVPFQAPFDHVSARRLRKEQVQECMKEGFAAAVRSAEGTGIRVCFETTPHEIFALSGTEDIAWMLEQVPDLGLVFDTANMLPHGDDTIEAYEALKDRIVHVHLKDVALSESHKRPGLMREHTEDGRYMTRTLWGQGVIPVNDIYRRLLRDGYKGRFAIEYDYPSPSRPVVDTHVQQVGRFLEYLERP